MKFLNPKTDFAFKKIFGSEESRDILLSFLNAILNLRSPYQLVDIEILDPYLAPKIRGMKDTFLDVRAKDEKNRWYIIEMQVLNVAGFEKRIFFMIVWKSDSIPRLASRTKIPNPNESQ